MGNILTEHKKSEIRFASNDGKIVLYNPTIEQENELTQIISTSIMLNNNKTENELELNYVREIFRMLVKDGAFVDELSDEELVNQLNEGDRDIVSLKQGINDIINELREDVIYEYTQQIKQYNSLLNIYNSNLDAKKMEEKINKLLKKNKIDMKFEEFTNIQGDPEKLEKLIKKISDNKINKK